MHNKYLHCLFSSNTEGSHSKFPYIPFPKDESFLYLRIVLSGQNEQRSALGKESGGLTRGSFSDVHSLSCSSHTEAGRPDDVSVLRLSAVWCAVAVQVMNVRFTGREEITEKPRRSNLETTLSSSFTDQLFSILGWDFPEGIQQLKTWGRNPLPGAEKMGASCGL